MTLRSGVADSIIPSENSCLIEILVLGHGSHLCKSEDLIKCKCLLTQILCVWVPLLVACRRVHGNMEMADSIIPFENSCLIEILVLGHASHLCKSEDFIKCKCLLTQILCVWVHHYSVLTGEYMVM